ncbi:MAG: hypothetical protein QXV82_08910 [Ignisphaera sp.]
MSFDQIQQLVVLQKQMSEALTAALKMYGISMTFEKIILYPEDEPSSIDLVYRVRCENEYVCEMLKKEFRRRLQESEGGEDGVGEQGED